jgi:hypothetical protein
MVEIIKAVALPVAMIFVAVCVVIVVLLLARKGSPLRIKVKDWVEIGGGVDVETNHLARATVDHAKVVAIQSQEAVDSSASTSSDETVIQPHELPADASIFDAKTLEDFEKCFRELELEEGSFVNTDIGFWQSYRATKRATFRKVSAIPELLKIFDQNKDTVWPSVDIISLYSNAGKMKEAKDHLYLALERPGASGFDSLLKEAVELLAKPSFDQAVAFVREKVLEGASDTQVAVMVGALADHANESAPSFGNVVLRELELSLDERRFSSLWKLAHGYGSYPFLELLGYRRYRELVLADESVGPALNNMSIIAASYDDSICILHQEEAIEKQELYAIGNIAARLIAAGFLDRAKKVLEAVDDNNTPTVLRARTALQEAVEKRDKKLSRLREIAKDEGAKIRTVVVDAFKYLWIAGGVIEDGEYSSIDQKSRIEISNDKAEISLTIDGKDLSGELERDMLWFFGSVGEYKSGLAIVSAERRHVLAVPSGQGQLSMAMFNGDDKFSPAPVVAMYLAGEGSNGIVEHKSVIIEEVDERV